SRVGSRGIAGCAGAAPCGPIRVARIRIARIAVAGREAGLAGSEPEARILKAGIHADGTGGEPPFTQARLPEPDAGPGPQVLPGPDAGFGPQALLGAQMRPADVLLARADVLLGRKLALRELLAGHFAAPHALARGRMSLRHLGAGAGCLGMGSGLRIGAGCRSFLSRPRGRRRGEGYRSDDAEHERKLLNRLIHGRASCSAPHHGARYRARKTWPRGLGSLPRS